MRFACCLLAFQALAVTCHLPHFRLAILQKHGFKPHEEVRSDQRGDSDPLGDVDTIPEHILNDEVLYRKYLEENVFQKDHSPEVQEETRGSKSGSFSSLMNIFSAVKKSVMSKTWVHFLRACLPKPTRWAVLSCGTL